MVVFKPHYHLFYLFPTALCVNLVAEKSWAHLKATDTSRDEEHTILFCNAFNICTHFVVTRKAFVFWILVGTFVATGTLWDFSLGRSESL